MDARNSSLFANGKSPFLPLLEHLQPVHRNFELPSSSDRNSTEKVKRQEGEVNDASGEVRGMATDKVRSFPVLNRPRCIQF